MSLSVTVKTSQPVVGQRDDAEEPHLSPGHSEGAFNQLYDHSTIVLGQPAPRPSLRRRLLNKVRGQGEGEGCCSCRSGRGCTVVTLLVFIFVVAPLMTLAASFYFSAFQADFHTSVGASVAVHTMGLAGGVTARVVPSSHHKGALATLVRVPAGALADPSNKIGLAHTVEHMAFDGTKDYPGRGGLMRAVPAAGVPMFNAVTTMRNTAYFFYGLPSSSDSLHTMLKLHRNQILGQCTAQSALDVEKGAILGEERMRTGAALLAIQGVLDNHCPGGLARHLSAGESAAVQGFTAEDIEGFVDRYYRRLPLDVWVIGDLEAGGLGLDEVTAAVEEAFDGAGAGPGETQLPEGPAKCIPRAKSVHVEMNGADSVQVNLMVTTPYISEPWSRNHYRRDTLNKLVGAIVSIQATLRFRTEVRFDSQGIGSVGMASQNLYSIGHYLHLFSIITPGPAHLTAWRSYLRIASQELHRLAAHGLGRISMFIILAAVRSGIQEVVDGLAGDTTTLELLMYYLATGLDPKSPPLTIHDRIQAHLEFLGLGFTGHALSHIQAHAQFVVASLARTIFPEDGLPDHLASDPYVGYVEAEASISIVSDGVTEGDVLLEEVMSVLRGALKHPPRSGSLIADPSLLAEFATGGVGFQGTMALLSDALRVEALGMARSGWRLMAAMGIGGDGTRGAMAAASLPPSLPLLCEGCSETDIEPPTKVHSVTARDNGPSVTVHRLSSGHNLVIVNTDSVANGKHWDGLHFRITSLGGRAALPQGMLAACRYLYGRVTPSGFSARGVDGSEGYIDHGQVREYMAHHKITNFPRVLCSDEFLEVDMVVSRGCTAKHGCRKPRLADLYRHVELLRLHTSPLYTRASIDDAGWAQYEQERFRNSISDPMDRLSRVTTPAVLSQAFGANTYMQELGHGAMSKIDPGDAGMFMEGQFTPERSEIVVAGGIDAEEDILRAFNMVFSAVSSSAPRRIGFDIYDANNAPAAPVWLHDGSGNVDLRDVVETQKFGRVVKALVMPGPSYKQLGHWKPGVLSSILRDSLSTQMFQTLREKHGLSYFAQVLTHHSVFFPEYGRITVTWWPGAYPASQTDPNNESLSSILVLDALRKPIPEEVVRQVKPATLRRAELAAQGVEFWMDVITGVTLKPPATWTGEIPPILKDLQSAVSYLDDLVALDVSEFAVLDSDRLRDYGTSDAHHAAAVATAAPAT